jgi:hypothetical protein
MWDKEKFTLDDVVMTKYEWTPQCQYGFDAFNTKLICSMS